MAKKSKTVKSKIVAKLPSVELSRLNAADVIWIDVRLWGEKQGWLQLAKGGIEWWPDYNKVNAHPASWLKFVELLETLPKRRRRKKSD